MQTFFDDLRTVDFETIARRLTTVIIKLRRRLVAEYSQPTATGVVSLLGVIVIAVSIGAAMWWRLRSRRQRGG